MKKLLLSSILIATSFGVLAQSQETVASQLPAASPLGTSIGTVWRAPTAIIYSNGALQTAATGGGAAGNQPISALTAPDTAFGSTCVGATFRLADDFVVPAGGVTLGKVTVFGYQTQAAPGGSTVSTLTTGTLQIWNGAPNVAGSTIVFGDTTTNRVTATSFSTVWRAQATAPTNVQRPAMAAEFGGLNVNLPAGTYYIDYGLAGSTASGPFCPPNNVVSAANNALQFNVATSTWVAAADGGSLRPLDFPFILETPVVVGAPTITPVTAAGAVSFTLPATRAFVFNNAAAATASGTVACTIAGPGFSVVPTTTQTIAAGASATFTVSATAAGTGTLTCTIQGVAQPVVYNLTAGAPVVLIPTPTLSLWSTLALLMGLGLFGALTVRRFS